jgi:16S rRNA (cytosine1402-N4)-methyltransferase
MGIRAPRSNCGIVMTQSRHTPVLLERTLELLAPALEREGAVMIDATLGLGGHTEAALTRFPLLTVIGFDRDGDALAASRTRLAPFGDRFRPVHTVYDGVRAALDELGIRQVDAVLFDLGVSSMQLDEAERGFAYSQDAPLDMRMDRTTGITAATVLATYPEDELRKIFYAYGEEKLAPRYARRIVEARATSPIERSTQLNQIIFDATPRSAQRTGHPAKRVYQALRIEVNAELVALEAAIPAALDALNLGGRIVVLSYQSLEDRIVKRELARRTASTSPQGLPVELPDHAPRFRLLVRGAERASDRESAENPRAIPVRLRAAERIRVAA